MLSYCTFFNIFLFRTQTHQWSEGTIKTIVRRDWLVKDGVVERTMNMIVTPRVQREVRAHFNCDSLEGAELEDQGEDGTTITHWEKRVFEVIFFSQTFFYKINYQVIIYYFMLVGV